MRLIRTVLLLLVLVVVGVFVYNYWSGHGWTLSPPSGSAGIDADEARRKGTAVAKDAMEKAGVAAAKVEDAVSEGTITAKIKSKMVLDDHVKARIINVTTTGSVVTLTGAVESVAERDRAVQLAKDTTGVSQVVDKLTIRKP
jgi:hyperosmotically inducible protein